MQIVKQQRFNISDERAFIINKIINQKTFLDYHFLLRHRVCQFHQPFVKKAHEVGFLSLPPNQLALSQMLLVHDHLKLHLLPLVQFT